VASLTLKKGRPDGPPSPWVILAAWGPCGWSPVVPGTVGTLGAIPLFWALRQLPLWAYLAATAALLLVAIPAATHAGRYWKVTDASPIVIDEVVGFLVTMAFFPWTWGNVLAGFLLFRIADVTKPWPASALDRVKSGLGVVLDDVAAGVWAALALGFLQVALGILLGCTGDIHWWCMELTP
jgi:phosphatidylglycerophosphatase A